MFVTDFMAGIAVGYLARSVLIDASKSIARAYRRYTADHVSAKKKTPK